MTKGLNLAAQDGLTSIAFPPLGTGFRFKYDSYTVANTMISAILMFLLDKPDSLQVKKERERFSQKLHYSKKR